MINELRSHGADGYIIRAQIHMLMTPEAYLINPISFPERYADSYRNELDSFHKCYYNKTERIKVTLQDCLNCFHIIKACKLSLS